MERPLQLNCHKKQRYISFKSCSCLKLYKRCPDDVTVISYHQVADTRLFDRKRAQNIVLISLSNKTQAS